MTEARSEKEDKKIWHRAWRRREASRLHVLKPAELDGHIPLVEADASSTWKMAKDGKQFWSNRYQRKRAEWEARGFDGTAKAAAIKRFLKKTMSK